MSDTDQGRGFDPARVPVFVFGSNLAGRHGKGAALWARQYRGAIYGQGRGIQGDSYAIPTKGHRLEVLPLWMIKGFVSEFLEFARKYWMREFQLTPIGCGYAGYTREQIEPMFADAPDNVIWPPEWASQADIEARIAASIAFAQRDQVRRDSDGSGEAGETAGLDPQGDSAGAQHIAQNTPPLPSQRRDSMKRMAAIQREPRIDPIAPTRETASSFELEPILEKTRNGRNLEIGKRYRRKRMVETLYAQGLFSEDEFKALVHYRHHADIADRSPLKDSLANLMRISSGSGNGPTVTLLNAVRLRDDVERAVGSLVDILRAVVVDDISLADWAISCHGAVEISRNNGKTELQPKKKAFKDAKIDIKMAAIRVESELSND